MPNYLAYKAPGFDFKDEEFASDIMAQLNYVRTASPDWEWLVQVSPSFRQADTEGALTNTLEARLNEKVQITLKEITVAEADALRLALR
jgi:hypothetical protein